MRERFAVPGLQRLCVAVFFALAAALVWQPVVCAAEIAQGDEDRKSGKWLILEPGLEFGEFEMEDPDSRLAVLRIDPEMFEFTLGAAGGEDGIARTLEQWADKKSLVAAINASMYLPDGTTSTGYMRNGEYINNPRIVERFGAFFVANPDSADLPSAMILDKETADWVNLLKRYSLAIQNYRMTNAQRRILWSPGGPLYSISAVAQDGAGKILFLHSRAPVEAYKFVELLLTLPIDVRTVLYVEGGAQAGLLINSEGFRRDLSGTHAPSFFVTGNLKASLPNVLGVRRRSASGDNEKTLQ